MASLNPGLRWAVTVHGDDRDLYTWLHVYARDRLVASSGFGGPPLDGESLMSEYRGRRDDLPWFVMARTAPIVDRVVATTDAGSEITLELSPPIDRFGLRFAVAALPIGEDRAVFGSSAVASSWRRCASAYRRRAGHDPQHRNLFRKR